MTEEPALVASALDKTRPADERVTAVERLAAIESASYDVWRALCSIFNDETEDRSVRVAAMRAMGVRFPAAAPNQLCRYIAGDIDRLLRREAIAVLGQIGHVPGQMESRLQRDLLSASSDTKSHTPLNLAMQYGRDPRALAALRGISRSRETEVRATALQALGMLGEMSDVVNAIHDGQPRVRVSATETLGHYSVLEPAEVAALEEALTDSDETVRRAAKTALRRLGVQKTPKTRTRRATRMSTMASQAVHFAWEPLLNSWSQEWLNVREYAVEAPDEVIESDWLGYPGASEEQIASAEQRLGITLPPSYHEFLRVSNGWRRTSPFIEQMWQVEQIKPFTKRARKPLLFSGG